MEIYILKSGICLAIFYGFYKLVLEKESFHVFKRFYLLFSVVLAFGIPLITFTEYIEVIPQEVPLSFPESSITHTVIEAEPTNYIPIILWSIYGLGILLFSFKFLKNLSGVIFRIKRNPKFKNQSFIHVLLQDVVIPHTFLSYIFLNKHKFETHQIPKEVLLHEETHAKQRHSLDVLFIELLQILFWFNPFIYFIKRSIKLNHEFLADQAVINNGVTPSTYQQILLAFSSNASEPQLANAINYSSIKKRFTVMKTHTSKQAFWLRSFILLPLLALLIYSFSEKQIVEKPQVFKIVNGEIKVHITKDKKVIIDNETIDFNSISDKLLELTKEETIKPTVQINVEGEVDTEYLEKIKNELKESNLDISTISAKSIHLDEKNDNYLKVNKSLDRINYVADSIVVIGNLRAKYITVFQLDSNSKNIKVDKLKTNQSLFSINKKGEVVAQKMQKATLEDNISITINQKGILVVNKNIVQIRNLKEFLNDLTKDLTKGEKEKIVVNLISYEAPDEVLTRVKSILRESVFLKINITKSKQKFMEMPMNSQEQNFHRKVIDDYLKEHPESMTKLKSESGETIEIVEIPTELMPPPPPPPAPILSQNPSKELLEAKKKYDEKGNAYGEAMQVYFKEKKITLPELRKMYDDTMVLYKEYSDLAKKETKASKN